MGLITKTAGKVYIKYHTQKIFSICFQYPSRICHIGTIMSRRKWTLLSNSLANHMLDSYLQKNEQ